MMPWGPEGRTQAKWSLGETCVVMEESERPWWQRPCWLCEADWAAFRGWQKSLEDLARDGEVALQLAGRCPSLAEAAAAAGA